MRRALAAILTAAALMGPGIAVANGDAAVGAGAGTGIENEPIRWT